MDNALNFCKVEGYYEIVKEPMDFGTMRAKLHEGMYETLEQFEVCFFLWSLDIFIHGEYIIYHLTLWMIIQHDVFLIPANAMLFNSSGSVYSRQVCFNVLGQTHCKKTYINYDDHKLSSWRILKIP